MRQGWRELLLLVGGFALPACVGELDLSTDSGTDAADAASDGEPEGGSVPDGGDGDGASDAGGMDGSAEDAGGEDGGTEDSGSADGGTEDAGGGDAGAEDADTGVVEGEAVCATTAEFETFSLSCSEGYVVDTIVFASYGTATGECGEYAASDCDAATSESVVEEACLGVRQCSVDVLNQTFEGDPCPGTPKRLTVEARCVPDA